MKGNALVGQSGGPTSVINASLAGVVQAALGSPGVGSVYGMRWGIEGLLAGDVTDLGREEPGTIEALRRTPSSALGSSRHRVVDGELPGILARLEELDVRYLFLAGGNDTMETLDRVGRYCRERGYELATVGVPKTVDNDLFGTDHTPGYGSAARYVAISVGQAGRLAEDMQRVDRFVVHQTVGRSSGWLAAASALARERPGDAPHLIYLPERPIRPERVVREVTECVERFGWASIVCGEGIVWSDGSAVSSSKVRDRFANTEFGAAGGTSAAFALHGLISRETGYRGEFQITESLAMCAIDRASALDLDEAYRCGRHAVALALSGASGVMVSIEREGNAPYAARLAGVPLGEVALRAKPLPPGFIAESGADVTAAFVDYARPLAGELPRYARLSHPSALGKGGGR